MTSWTSLASPRARSSLSVVEARGTLGSLPLDLPAALRPRRDVIDLPFAHSASLSIFHGEFGCPRPPALDDGSAGWPGGPPCRPGNALVYSSPSGSVLSDRRARPGLSTGPGDTRRPRRTGWSPPS